MNRWVYETSRTWLERGKLVFAERCLWNRFVPSLDGYIQDRLNNPVHLPGHGTLHTLRLEAPPLELVTRIVEARLRPALEQLPDFAALPASGLDWDVVQAPIHGAGEDRHLGVRLVHHRQPLRRRKEARETDLLGSGLLTDQA